MANVDKILVTQVSPETPQLPGHCFAITTSDTTTYSTPVSVYVGVTGNVSIIPDRGDRTTAVTFLNVPAGNIVPCRAYKVMAALTTATNLIGLV